MHSIPGSTMARPDVDTEEGYFCHNRGEFGILNEMRFQQHIIKLYMVKKIKLYNFSNLHRRISMLYNFEKFWY